MLLVDGLSQLCDKGNQMIFDKDKCEVKCIKSGKVIIIFDPRCDNIYSMFTNKADGLSKGKQTNGSFKPKKFVSTFQPIELLHFDLYGPMLVKSPKGK